MLGRPNIGFDSVSMLALVFGAAVVLPSIASLAMSLFALVEIIF